MPLPTVGERAPAFSLPSTSGQDVVLSGLRGRKVLLAFFPKAFTGVCTAEMCALSDDYDVFASANTVVLPISVDAIDTLQDFKERERLAVDLLSDAAGDVCRRYGTFLEEYHVSNRVYLLLDAEGVVRWLFAEDNPGTRRENSEILEQIEALARDV